MEALHTHHCFQETNQSLTWSQAKVLHEPSEKDKNKKLPGKAIASRIQTCVSVESRNLASRILNVKFQMCQGRTLILTEMTQGYVFRSFRMQQLQTWTWLGK